MNGSSDTDTAHTTVNGHKTCSACRLTLPVIHFAIQSRAKDGLRGQCRACYNAKQNRYPSVTAKRINQAKKKIALTAADEYRRDYCLAVSDGEVDFGEAISE